MSKPPNYPLPWCDRLDLPYWRANHLLCRTSVEWRDWQSRRDMRGVIAKIDEILDAISKVREVAPPSAAA